MANFKTKATASTIALFLTLAMVASLVLPTTAQESDAKKTYAYIGAVPNPAGVGQEVLLHVGITQELQSVEMGWEDLSITIEHPEGTVIETKDNIKTDSTGGTGRTFIPQEEGIYYIQSHFPEQVTTAEKAGGSMFTGYIPEGTVMLSSESEKLELVVQAEQIEYYKGVPLPSEYWTRPIDGQLREWAPIAGNWIWGAGQFGGASIPNRYAPYNEDAPETAHILWTTPMTTGGLAGGSSANSYSSGDAYEGKFPGPLIIAGKLYYTTGGSRGLTPIVYHCVDLHTGEELWTKTFMDNQTLSFGQVFLWDSFNYHGVFSYLYITTGGSSFFGPPTPESWYAFDPFTGDWRFTINNVPSGTTLRDANGGLYRLQIDQTNGWMALWNFSALVQNTATGSDRGSWGNVIHMQTLDAGAGAAAQLAWSWNKTISTALPGSVQMAEFDDKVVGGTVTATEVTSWGLSLEDGAEGETVYNPRTWNAPAEWATGNLTVSWAGSSLADNVFVVWVKETREFYGFSTETGAPLWKTDPQYYMDYHVATESAIVDGKLFSVGVSGIVYCYNLTSGELAWKYEISDPYQEILWANNWWGQILFITDGKIYIGHSEHSPLNPMPRGAPFVCLDMETGDVIFRADGLFRQTHWGGTAIIGDSIIATQDSYDQRVYAIGKGPSAITVSVKNPVVTDGESVLVEGMVTDVSPGTEEYGLTARFPNGVPAVSDDNMSEWMLYVYKQFPKPADVMGVNVTISVIDPNGNTPVVGTATCNSNGFYKLMFEPEVPGEYTVIASFAGSNAYYGSQAETALGVLDVPPPPQETPASEPMTDAYVIGLGISGIVAIVAIGLILILMLRRR